MQQRGSDQKRSFVAKTNILGVFQGNICWYLIHFMAKSMWTPEQQFIDISLKKSHWCWSAAVTSFTLLSSGFGCLVDSFRGKGEAFSIIIQTLSLETSRLMSFYIVLIFIVFIFTLLYGSIIWICSGSDVFMYIYVFSWQLWKSSSKLSIPTCDCITSTELTMDWSEHQVLYNERESNTHVTHSR